MVTKNAVRLMMGIAAVTLLLSMSWDSTPSASTKAFGAKPSGIRLVAPVCGRPLCLFVEPHPCEGPPATLLVGAFGTAPFAVSVTGPDGRSVQVLPGDGSHIGAFVANLTGQYKVSARDARGVAEEITDALIPCSSLTQSEWARNKPKFNGEKRAKTIRRLVRDSLFGKTLVVGVSGERSITFPEDSAGCAMQLSPQVVPLLRCRLGLAMRASTRRHAKRHLSSRSWMASLRMSYLARLLR